MARPLRIEFAGGLYHVTSRGNAREDIYVDDDDRIAFLELLHKACNRYDWYCHAYCLMSNHYHLLIETGTSSLSKGMKYINGTYTQGYNRTHKRVGHVFQGRYKAILVEKDSYLPGRAWSDQLKTGNGVAIEQQQDSKKMKLVSRQTGYYLVFQKIKTKLREGIVNLYGSRKVSHRPGNPLKIKSI